ncbi:lysophospholipid transporter LplT [Brackiella oedipodis]|uniref:lysophospholipid transporter LplT n=1 Tax=Brackiella oedipodis TaxID=124225 RepID=UPI00048B5455|nr:lysophospholipid transporter LplT [Brackiella oedipodis]
MKKGFYLVLLAQALSSLADNALFIAAIALIAELQGPEWMTPIMKWFFAFAYVILAAYVGAIADSFPKGKVMFVTNAIKLGGCLMMFAFGFLDHDNPMLHAYIVCLAYGVVGIGAAAYSPAKYGIVTEMLAPKDLVKGNSWIEGLTVISIILGVVFGGFLTNSHYKDWLLNLPIIHMSANTQAEAAIIIIGFVYVLAALCNLSIPNTHFKYPKQEKNPVQLTRNFARYVVVLWRDRVGQISLAVTTLFWGAGATIQVLVLEWGKVHLGISISESANLMGITAVGTVIGASLASRVPLEKSLHVLPVGVIMGLSVLLMIVIKSDWAVISTLIFIGALSGFFVVPMNALLQHRGHVLLSAGHSIAVQNFNEQLNILLMVGIYTILIKFHFSIYAIITFFGLIVTVLMALVIVWNRNNEKHFPEVYAEIGDTSHGRKQ